MTKISTPKSPSVSHQIFSIGYSTHTIEFFIDLLKAHAIEMIIDIRTIPKSRHCPEYNQEELKAFLKSVKIGYRHLKDLGGLRHALKNSLNTGWINASFRGFADYMQTPSFQKGLEKLEKIAQKKRCVLMCAEGVPWRCHRSLIADALTLKKWQVFHIQSKKTAKLHALTPFLHVKDGKLIYSERY
ncbi:MAG: DNA repair protein [Parachlamydia sp.]|nr:MAG: DNA repair protein [Parachlamydia sp.]